MIRRIVIFAGSLLWLSSTVHAGIMSFTPSGTATVSQTTDLRWDMLSDATSTSSFFLPYNLELTDHGDIHFNSSTIDFINDGSGTTGLNLVAGTLIDASSPFGNNASFVGTTSFGGGAALNEPTIYGLSLQIAGQTHYGWVSFQENPSTQSLIGWAYNDQAGVAIAAGDTGVNAVPEPGTVLAFGLIGFCGMVRRRHRATVQI